MEVDLLCADARLAIDLDGAQYLSDPDAYRRDRRKDCLLQQNGYFVLRFLAEDIGIRLEEVLDTILQILARLRPRRPYFVTPSTIQRITIGWTIGRCGR